MWEIVFVNHLAEQEILALTPDLKAKFIRITDLLLSYGHTNVGMPHVRFIEEKLWELRFKGKDNITRSIYTLLKGKRILILHTFIKKTEKTPRAAIEIALNRLKEFKND